MKFYTTFLLFGFLLLQSCSPPEDGCIKSTTNPAIARFYTYYTDTLGQTSKVNIEFYGITALITFNGVLDTLIKYGQGISSLSIPLDPFNDSTDVLLYIDSFQASPDKITIYYRPIETFIDLSCGIAYEFYLDTATGNRYHIDSLKVKNRNLKLNNSDENLEILFF